MVVDVWCKRHGLAGIETGVMWGRAPDDTVLGLLRDLLTDAHEPVTVRVATPLSLRQVRFNAVVRWIAREHGAEVKEVKLW